MNIGASIMIFTIYLITVSFVLWYQGRCRDNFGMWVEGFINYVPIINLLVCAYLWVINNKK